MSDTADLEISLYRRDIGRYSAELRFTRPGSDADIRLLQQSAALRIEFDRLRAVAIDLEEYGLALGRSLFGDPALRAAFHQALSHAQAARVPLRLRLYVDSSAQELAAARWETLRDPETRALLFTGEQIYFSRYLSSSDWQPVLLRPRQGLRALVAVAAPADLAAYGLAPIDAAAEAARVAAAMGDIAVSALAADGPVSLDRIGERLREGFDILYLVCHGRLKDGEPWLYLEDEARATAVVRGLELADRVRELAERPRLIVLASCQSAGGGDDPVSSDRGAQAFLGPRLAEAGVPAVVAMQGNVSQGTVGAFMPAFFRELWQHGQIDRAISLARGAVRGRHDFWMPVLFMRLKSGRIWYVSGFGDDPQGFSRWPALSRAIRAGRCTPILGFGLAESIAGSSREIARRWAGHFNFPMAPHEREDLPQVAQFLAINQDRAFPAAELTAHIGQEVLRRFGAHLPPGLANPQAPGGADRLIEAAGALLRRGNPLEPYAVLARLPLPIYLNTNPSSLLESALIEVGKEPRVALCPWNEYIERNQEAYDETPTPGRPLVYHLFGHIRDERSLVLTEDDYFDYLIGVTSNKDLIPEVVRRALADTSLLFLGFPLDGWNFRVLFRAIMRQEGSWRRSRYAHVGVQIDPEEGRIIEVEGARRYLEAYFREGNISIYWGSLHDFIRDLHQQFGLGAVTPGGVS